MSYVVGSSRTAWMALAAGCLAYGFLAAAGSARADVVGVGPYGATAHYANPHAGESLGSFDFSDGGDLYYNTGSPSFATGFRVYRYDGAGPAVEVYSDAQVYAGPKVKAIGPRVYFNDGGTSSRWTYDYYRYEESTGPQQVIDSTADGIDIWGLQTRDGTDLWAAGGWSAAIFTGGLDADGDLESKPLRNLGAIGGSAGPVAFDSQGNLYYAEGYNGSGQWNVYRWTADEVQAALDGPVADPLDPASHVFATLTTKTGATGLALDGEDRLFLTATEFDAPSLLLGVAAGGDNYVTLAQSDSRMGEVRWRDGRLYVADDGGIYTVAVPEPAAWSLLAVAGLAVACFALRRRSAGGLRGAAVLAVVAAGAVAAATASAEPMAADVLVYYEQGIETHGGIWADPTRAVDGDDGTGVSLGCWSDNPDQGTGIRPVGLAVGFSTSVRNGAGNDLKVLGNPFSGWYEPGYVEVARETSGAGATADGWQDETFYLIKPSNYDAVGDPRSGPLSVGYPYNAGWNQSVYGYADVALGGDLMDLDDAIDLAGNPVVLPEVAYVRIRTATDDLAGVFGSFSTEVMSVEALHGAVPEPATWTLAAVALVLAGIAGRRRRWRARRTQ